MDDLGVEMFEDGQKLRGNLTWKRRLKLKSVDGREKDDVAVGKKAAGRAGRTDK